MSTGNNDRSTFSKIFTIWNDFVRLIGVYAFVQIGKTYYLYKKKYPFETVYKKYERYDKHGQGKDFLCVDCLHPRAKTVTHHKQSSTPEEMKVGDTSSENVIAGIEGRKYLMRKKCGLTKVSCDHFDIDGLISCYSLLYPNDAVKYKKVLIEAARIGDFRELDLALPEDSLKALRLCSYVNQVEREEFNAPFVGDEKQNCMEKYGYFLEHFNGYVIACATADASRIHDELGITMEGQEEFEKVLRDVKTMQDDAIVEKWSDCLATVVRVQKQVHYYALFGATIDTDICIAIYAGRKYEIEHKYTTFVDIQSRETQPRIDLTELAKALNRMENGKSTDEGKYKWDVAGVTDTGPLLRLNDTEADARLTKAERYAHPDQRTINASTIPEDIFLKIVKSYLLYGAQSMFAHANKNPLFESRKVDCVDGVLRGKNWTWRETQTLNSAIDWSIWSIPSE